VRQTLTAPQYNAKTESRGQDHCLLFPKDSRCADDSTSTVDQDGTDR
jgi:hypothetical protein